MSFVGQFRPTFAANTGARRFGDSGAYLVGAVLSSTGSVALLHALIGTRARTWSTAVAVAAVVAFLAVLFAIDAVRVWAGRSSSLGPHRQTPQRWKARGWPGVFAWGLDTGVPFTTIRSTPLPLLGAALVAAGFGTPFHGLAYGLGLAAGVMSSVVGPAPAVARYEPAFAGLLRRRERLGAARLVLVPYPVVGAAAVISWLVFAGG